MSHELTHSWFWCETRVTNSLSYVRHESRTHWSVILRHNMSRSLLSDSSLTFMYMTEFVTHSYVRERVRDSFICIWERLISDTATQDESLTHQWFRYETWVTNSLISDSVQMWDMSHELTHQWFCDATWVTHVWTHVCTHSLVIQMWDMSHELTHQWFCDTTWVMNSCCVISDSRPTSMYMREFVTHSYVYNRDFTQSYETWVTHSRMRHDSSTRVTWLVHNNMTHLYASLLRTNRSLLLTYSLKRGLFSRKRVCPRLFWFKSV